VNEVADALAEIAAGIRPPGAEAEQRADEVLARAGVTEARHGRLAELARWWVTTSEDVCGPASAVQLWGAPETGGTAIRVEVPRAPEDVDAAIAWGPAAVDAAIDGGADLLVVSVADRVAAQVLAAHLIEVDAVEAVGWPGQAGLADAAWSAEVIAVRDGLRRLTGLRAVPAPVLRALGSPLIAAATGALLQAAVRRTPVVLDGMGAAAAGLLARRVERKITAWWQVASLPEGELVGRVLNWLGRRPLLRLDLRIEDGTGARLALAVLREATDLLSERSGAGEA
jgi:nicotinate-nucleotide--dimethylbenzimidazole phosphoribosyltransferase